MPEPDQERFQEAPCEPPISFFGYVVVGFLAFTLGIALLLVLVVVCGLAAEVLLKI